MEFSELTPEERLYTAIFGETAIKDDGIQALHDVLKRFQEKHGYRGIKVLRLRLGLDHVTDEEIAKRRARRVTHSAYDERCCLSPCRTLDEVAGDFNVTRERIRQIEAKTLWMLRRYYSGKLKQYIGTS